MNTAYLLLGTNLLNRKKNLKTAIYYLEKCDEEITKRSSVYETEPWGKKEQDHFLNIALEIQTHHSANELMGVILEIEKQMGRERKEKWSERIIDIDILFFNDEIMNGETLCVPHPYLHERRFALVPLAEIAEDFVHPVLKKSVKELLSYCTDNLLVSPYVSK